MHDEVDAGLGALQLGMRAGSTPSSVTEPEITS
jgi:hypothetical protein